MALTRKSLKAMGLTEEQVESIVEMHAETVDGLKQENANNKAAAQALETVQAELEQAKTELESIKNDGFKSKYENLKTEFENYKTDVQKKESHAAKESAYKTLLQRAGINEKRTNQVLRLCDVDAVELDEVGNIKDADALTRTIQADFSDYIATTTIEGATSYNPPNNAGAKTYTSADISKMSTQEINQNWDAIKASLKTERG